MAATLTNALKVFTGAAESVSPFLSVTANLPTNELVPELGFDCVPGNHQRDFFQQFVPDERWLPYRRYPFPKEAAVRLMELTSKHPEGERIQRAVVQYHAALQNWSPGRDILALGLLWMGMETLTPVALRAELAMRAVNREGLCSMWGIELKNCDPEVRRRLLFKSEDQIYRDAKSASDGFEHGFLPFDVVKQHAVAAKLKTASLLRSAIFEYVGLEAHLVDQLTAAPFAEPKSLRFDKYVKGILQGELARLTDPAEMYPRFSWTTKPTGIQIGPDRSAQILFNEEFTAVLGPGTTFTGKSLEVWGG